VTAVYMPSRRSGFSEPAQRSIVYQDFSTQSI